MFYTTSYSSPVGTITLACDNNNLVGLWLENQKYYGGSVLSKTMEKTDSPILDLSKKWLDRYFVGEKPSLFELPLAPIGSEFRQTVWNLLCEIPYGETSTYSELAKKTAQRMNRVSMSCQAIGGAVGHNPISIIIPCHRVLGSDGSLTGYAGGINKKAMLLKLEGIVL